MPVQHGPKSGGRDVFGEIWDALEGANMVGKKIRQQLLTPTHPIYDSYHFPQNPVEGQKCIDYRGLEWFFLEKCWREITQLSYCFAAGGVAGSSVISVPSGTDYAIPFSGMETSNKRVFGNDPAQGGAWNDNIDIAHGASGSQISTMYFNTPGLYLVIADVRFQQDGAVYTKSIEFQQSGISLFSESPLFTQSLPTPASYDPGISPVAWGHLMKWAIFIGFYTGGFKTIVRHGAGGNKSIGGDWVPANPPEGVVAPRILAIKLGNPFSITPGSNPDGSGQSLSILDPSADPLYGNVTL